MIRAAIIFTITAIVIYLFSISISNLPPLGIFFHPHLGFWGNAETTGDKRTINTNLHGLTQGATVWYDMNHVPHIAAANEHDLFVLQGYIMAKDRLWQMEFLTHVAAGRVAEIIGNKGIEFDVKQRQKGMVYAAKNSLELYQNDTVVKRLLDDFAFGVNTYIDEMSASELPIEYKLLNYKPEKWTPLKSILIQKLMADDLTGDVDDFKNTAFKKDFSLDIFKELFSLFPDSVDAIVPYASAASAFNATTKESKIPTLYQPKQTNTNAPRPAFIAPKPTSLDDNDTATFLNNYVPKRENGSNNWAIAPSKSEDSTALLANDPHLQLRLPSIWYQMHLTCPKFNVYGVSLPGSPLVVIGFNEHIAWGVTNASRDVLDYYKIKFKDDTKEEYELDSTWLKTTKRKEIIIVKNGTTVEKEIIYTHWGPLQDKNADGNYYAMQWMGHRPGKEMLALHGINKAENYEEFQQAITHFDCPAQNFVFASIQGDIAIHQQGRFPYNKQENALFTNDGSSTSNGWTSFATSVENPKLLNPLRGFVSSANQHPTDNTYSTPYVGNFEFYRNRIINQFLGKKEKVNTNDLKNLQCNNYSLLAAENLPYILTLIDNKKLDITANNIHQILSEWDHKYDAESTAATYFEIFKAELYALLWDELDENKYPIPDDYATMKYLKTQSDSALFFDIDSTINHIETKKELVSIAFYATMQKINSDKENEENLQWYAFKKTNITHILNLPSFSKQIVKIGGNSHIVNACSSSHGPSWRMIVKLEKNIPVGMGVYPGGQSGNPGSKYYDNMIDTWAKGDYYDLVFYKSNDVNKFINKAKQIIILK